MHNRTFAKKIFDSIQDELCYDFDEFCGDQKDDIIEILSSWVNDVRRETKRELIKFLDSQEV